MRIPSLPFVFVPLCLTAVLPPAAAQRPKPSNSRPPVAASGAFDPARQALLSVPAPALLSRGELARRLRKLDGTLPVVLPAGGSIVLTPGNIQAGRANLEIHGAEFVGLNRVHTPVAGFTDVQEAGVEAIFVEFDADADARHAVDVLLGGTDRPNPGGTFLVGAWGAGHVTTATVAPGADGHLLYLFDTPRAGRYTIAVQRPSSITTGRWYFYRAELLRVR